MNDNRKELKLHFNNNIKLLFYENISIEELKQTSLKMFDICSQLYTPNLFYIRDDSSLVELKDNDALLFVLSNNSTKKRHRINIELLQKDLSNVELTSSICLLKEREDKSELDLLDKNDSKRNDLNIINESEVWRSEKLNQEKVEDIGVQKFNQEAKNNVISEIQTAKEYIQQISQNHVGIETEIKMVDNKVNSEIIRTEKKSVNFYDINMVDSKTSTEKINSIENKNTKKENIIFEQENQLVHQRCLSNEENFKFNCSICSSINNSKFKYVCLICKELNLCIDCEDSHIHPTIKFKNNQLSSRKEAFILLKQHENKDFQELNKKSSGIFSLVKCAFTLTSSYAAKLTKDNLNENSTMRVPSNSLVSLTLTIQNVGIEDLGEETLIIVKNIQNLKIEQSNLGIKLKRNEYVDIHINIETQTSRIYDLELSLHNKNYEIIHDSLCFKLDVYNKIKEKDLLEFFKDYPELKTLDFQKKYMIRQIKNENLTNKNIKEVLEILERNNWIIHESIDELTSDY